MARKTGQIIRRGPNTWLVRIYVGRDPETRKRNYIGKSMQGGLRSAQAHLNRMLRERDLGRNIRSSRQTFDQYLDHWLSICAQRRWRSRRFTAICITGSCRRARFVTRTRSSSRHCGRRCGGSYFCRTRPRTPIYRDKRGGVSGYSTSSRRSSSSLRFRGTSMRHCLPSR